MKDADDTRLGISARGVVTASLVSLGLCVGVVLVADSLRTPTPPPQPAASQGFGNAANPAPAAAATAAGPAFDVSKLQPVDMPPMLGPATPTRVRIPAINVNAPLTRLALDSSGRLGAPPEQSRNLAGWYGDGASPGEVGTAVIAGHVDNKRGPAVFYNLGALKKGAEVDVDRSDGMTAVFTVDAVEAYDSRAFPSDKVYGDAARAELRVITCGAGFDKKHYAYMGNVVVFAHLTAAQGKATGTGQ
ncbi:peptidase C60 sortase A and B [Catenulispora acidiphila DSM 44928]|uniref:Peptidase C60 sortase A and B n=1 Tax=Catenulispora acidiphila (strain DSM 44928 / JCM 14897 / NBRC 102108 / NRRL B-24433 / ID139908) TaxID=479433 RepID=C7Q688_CATAD|nr:class F sortase [Catenulispora acidiphila]ACU72094.1 peptidase C60 sortase A and B [Catenulispora acidiphila DSM 44928]